MLTSLEIENFKGISTRQRIDFAPLTLLFGANSAGKSTILHALLYLHELIERGSAEVDRTEVGGDVLELGGFARLVHNHDVEQAIVLRVEFATPGGLERFGRDLTDFPFPDLDDHIDSAWMELTVRYRRAPTFRGPLIDQVTIGVNGVAEPIVRVTNSESLRTGEPLYVQINFAHPVIATTRVEHPELWPALEAGHPWQGVDQLLEEERKRLETAIDELSTIAVSQELLERALGKSADSSDRAAVRWRPFFAIAHSRIGALPAYSEALRVLPAGDIEGDKEEVASLRRQASADGTRQQRVEALESSIFARERAAQYVRTLLEMVVIGTTSQLAGFLRDAQYIGPLRTIPPRGFLYERSGRIRSWADGLAAWDLLLADRLTLVERTNAWLRRLGAGCQIVVQQLFEGHTDAEDLSDGHVDKTVRRLLLDTSVGSYVLPSEVGAGISQLIPVVVAALEGRYGLTLVEQPEIHVHPAVQVGLGDLFIEAATREGARRLLLVETHSEHLLLRVMRRMRETSEGNLPEGMRPVRPDDVAIVLVEKDGKQTIARKMLLNERGELVKAWPGGFFEEGLREVF